MIPGRRVSNVPHTELGDKNKNVHFIIDFRLIIAYSSLKSHRQNGASSIIGESKQKNR